MPPSDTPDPGASPERADTPSDAVASSASASSGGSKARPSQTQSNAGAAASADNTLDGSEVGGDVVIRTCLNCEEPLSGRFCGQCGQDHRDARLSIRELVSHFIEGITELDTPIWRTLIGLTIRPGVVCREYVEGRRKRFAGPVKYYLVTGAIWVLVISVFASDATEGFARLSQMIGANVEITQVETPPPGAAEADAPAGVGQRIIAHINDISPDIPSYSNWISLVTVPLVALLLSLLFVGSGMRVAEHAVLCLYCYGHSFLLTSPLAAVGFFALPFGALAIAIVPMVYLIWAAIGFYQVDWFSATWKMIVARIAQLFAAGILTLLIIAVVVTFRMLRGS